MENSKPICSLSLDLDNQWSYMKTHGDAGWEFFPSYLELVVPRFLKVLDGFGWKVTVFVVGQDAALEKNHDSLRMISEAGHEVGNHSFNHEPWLHLYSKPQIEEEISRAEEAIEAATGQITRGFRGPGYSVSRGVLEVLADREYLYDASTLPTFIGPLARAYYFMASNLSDAEKEQRRRLFGGFREGAQPITSYLWDLGDSRLLEIPVTTMPILRVPIHFSYLLYIGTFSPALSKLYFRAALKLCKAMGIRPSLLLHPLDFLGGDDVPTLGFFPAMRRSGDEKVEWLTSALRELNASFSVKTMAGFAAENSDSSGLPVRQSARIDCPRGGTDRQDKPISRQAERRL